ncbi:hypothetical protein IQ22_04570 [Pseudomonas duriflava]|uniref:Uncharacterized protein n=1 Tax=Pseudomonas duriflava TaxID=459528 RepID=A0A562PN32_9PSED|nr:hypothetical protein IQ22_04570 [Pseudomonas duriflava]
MAGITVASQEDLLDLAKRIETLEAAIKAANAPTVTVPLALLRSSI